MKIVVPIAVALIGLFAVGGSLLIPEGPYEDYRVPDGSSSMSPTLAEGDLITVRTDTADDLRRGDMVLIDGAAWFIPTDAPVVKRVIGIGGDRIESGEGGRVTVNGKPIDEDYVSLQPNVGEPLEFDVTVPDGSVFVAGDVRNNSFDSRVAVDEPSRGAFTPEAVLGTVVAINEEPLPPTEAFTRAGLAGDAYEDSGPSATGFIVLIGGLVLIAIGAASFVLVLRKRDLRTIAEASSNNKTAGQR